MKLGDSIKFLNVSAGIEEIGIIRTIRKEHGQLRVSVEGRKKLETIEMVDFLEIVAPLIEDAVVRR